MEYVEACAPRPPSSYVESKLGQRLIQCDVETTYFNVDAASVYSESSWYTEKGTPDMIALFPY